MRVMRINFSHATFEEADLRLGNLRAVSQTRYFASFLLFFFAAIGI